MSRNSFFRVADINVLINMGSFLDAKTLTEYCRINRQSNMIGSHPNLWKELYKHDFNRDFPAGEEGTPKKIYLDHQNSMVLERIRHALALARGHTYALVATATDSVEAFCTMFAYLCLTIFIFRALVYCDDQGSLTYLPSSVMVFYWLNYVNGVFTTLYQMCIHGMSNDMTRVMKEKNQGQNRQIAEFFCRTRPLQFLGLIYFCLFYSYPILLGMKISLPDMDLTWTQVFTPLFIAMGMSIFIPILGARAQVNPGVPMAAVFAGVWLIIVLPTLIFLILLILRFAHSSGVTMVHVFIPFFILFGCLALAMVGACVARNDGASRIASCMVCCLVATPMLLFMAFLAARDDGKLSSWSYKELASPALAYLCLGGVGVAAMFVMGLKAVQSRYNNEDFVPQDLLANQV